MIRIYVQNKPLFLVDKITKEVEGYVSNSDTFFADNLNPSATISMLNTLERREISAGVFQHSNLIELLDAFKCHLTLIKAAGGLVFTDAKEILLIFRKGKWDLPKGKQDEGETLMECAVREVKEETGIKDIQIGQQLSISYHTYYEKKNHILKESHWFLMETKKAVPLVPQAEEDIEKCLWIPLQDVSNYTSNMHASIVDVVNKGHEMLNAKP